ncbi:MAG: SGNH/GDSL hydrolase family protein [Actinomycetota bacterium]|nr:SGNH/GDSL hydrolase family protein [Actinomycetota bacterium]
MIKRILLLLLALVFCAALVLGIEIVLAMRREYLPTSPALEIAGTFGDLDARPITLAVLGDSTAAGVGAGTADRSYATRLAQRLAASGWRVRLVAVGISGARVGDVLSEQLPRALAEDPDLVFVGIGANDVTHVTRLASVEADMAAILDRLTATGAGVVVAGPPDMRSPVFHQPLRTLVGWRGNAVARAIEEAASEAGVPVVPLAEGTRDHFRDDPDRYYSDDEFHPSAAGYALWAEVIYPYLEDALRARERARP